MQNRAYLPGMKKVPYSDVVGHFEGKTNMAEALGISRQAVYLWDDEIPEIQARRMIEMDDFPWKFDQLPVKPFQSGSVQKTRKCA